MGGGYPVPKYPVRRGSSRDPCQRGDDLGAERREVAELPEDHPEKLDLPAPTPLVERFDIAKKFAKFAKFAN